MFTKAKSQIDKDDSLATLLDLHQLCLERLVLAELSEAVSHHDSPPPSLDFHLK